MRGILREPLPNVKPDGRVRNGMFGAPRAAREFCSVCFDRRPEAGCRAECSATTDGLWMSSSQSLTTLDMRGFHSLLAVWALLATVFRRWFADESRASGLGRVRGLSLDDANAIGRCGTRLYSGWANLVGPDGQRVRRGDCGQGDCGQGSTWAIALEAAKCIAGQHRAACSRSDFSDRRESMANNSGGAVCCARRLIH